MFLNQFTIATMSAICNRGKKKFTVSNTDSQITVFDDEMKLCALLNAIVMSWGFLLSILDCCVTVSKQISKYSNNFSQTPVEYNTCCVTLLSLKKKCNGWYVVDINLEQNAKSKATVDQTASKQQAKTRWIFKFHRRARKVAEVEK